MSPVNEEAPDPLKPPRPDDIREPVTRALLENFQRGESGDGILAVERTFKGEAVWDLRFVRHVRRIEKRRTNLASASLHDRNYLRFILPMDYRHTLLYYSCLFSGNFLDGVAKPVAMIEPNLRYDADLRRADVRRIKPTAKPSFENGIVALRLGKGDKRNGRQRLEESELRVSV